MSRKCTLAGLLVIVSLLANSQALTIGKLELGYAYIGPKLGGSMAFMTNTPNSTDDNVPLFGYTIGGVGKLGITEQIGIQTGLEYTRKGYKQEYSAGGEHKTMANYLGIPILAKINVIKIGKFRFHGSGGVYSNVAISIKGSYSYNEFSESSTYTSSETRRVDFGLNLGAGVQYDMGHGLLVIEASYEQGFVDVFKDNVREGRNTTQAIGLSATYLYDLVDFTKMIFKK